MAVSSGGGGGTQRDAGYIIDVFYSKGCEVQTLDKAWGLPQLAREIKWPLGRVERYN